MSPRTRVGRPLPSHPEPQQPPMREHEFRPNPACFTGHLFNLKKKEQRNANGTQNEPRNQR